MDLLVYGKVCELQKRVAVRFEKSAP